MGVIKEMKESFIYAAIKGITDRNDRTIRKLIFFFNSLFALVIVTSFLFPLRDIFLKYINLFNIRLIADITFVLWYCSLFIFQVSSTISIISLLISGILEHLEGKFPDYDLFMLSDKAHITFCTTHSAYIIAFDYFTLSSFILFFTVPTELILIITSFFQWTNWFINITIFFAFICAIECSISLLSYIIRKWIFPRYYDYKNDNKTSRNVDE